MGVEVQHAGIFRVTTDRGVVRAFKRETGWRDDDGVVPLCFPVVWMKRPEIRGAISVAAFPMGHPVHEAQIFEYAHPLQFDEEYDIAVDLILESEPSRLIATGRISTTCGKYIGKIVSTLRLFVAKPN